MASLSSGSQCGISLWDHRLWTHNKSALDIPPDNSDRLKDTHLEDSEDDDVEDDGGDSRLNQDIKSHPDDAWLKHMDAPHSCHLCSNVVILEDRLPVHAFSQGGGCILRLFMSDKRMWKAGLKCPLFRYLCSVFQERRHLRPHRYSTYAAVASDVEVGKSASAGTSPRKDLFIGVRDGKIKFLYRWPRFRCDDEDSPAGDALLPLPEALIYTRVMSDWAYSKAKAWIDDCTLHHVSCRLEPSSFVPTRLLDVTAIIDNKIRLVESKSVPNIGNHARWAALSYVWGGLQPVRTLKANIEDHHKGIPLAKLPPTIQHAIAVCQNIAIPHLWIDCLCIIQDDNDDLAVELQSMAQIYQYSTVTINAASADSVHKGFLQDRPIYFYEDTVYPVQISFRPSKSSPNPNITALLLKANNSYGLEDLDPIRTRGWTYQERKLPVRSLHYSTAGLEWSCRHIVATTVTGANKRDDPLSRDLPVVPGQALAPWSRIVSDYTNRKLSFPGDKITAVSAIAAIYEQEQKKTYVAGLWKEDMPACLVWSVMASGMRPRYGVYTGPSWSWASTDSHVSFKTEEEDEEGVVFYGTVLKAEAEPVMPKARFAAVKSASLVIRGRVHRVSLRVDFETVESDIEGVVSKEKRANVTVTAARAYADKIGVNLDAWEDGWAGDSGSAVVDVLLMPLFERTLHDPDIGMSNWGGLVVVETEKEAYRRIGYFEEYFYKRTVGRVTFADFIIGAELRDVLLV
ncbi:Putative protein of unknown function with het domain [Podospora comata]|uniref:Heterokaryon incompatibility domain-containing protein n=1 Tax=Podospora comata TaxID=48703 RepID=A0ABY6S804_PODCO|nr:Putative protein of unknown function with het domain [Podospora comata]